MYNINDRVYYAALRAVGTVKSIIIQTNAQHWYEVEFIKKGLYSMPHGSLKLFKSRKPKKKLGTESGDQPLIRALERPGT